MKITTPTKNVSYRKPTLVILAAGLGSRYGELKQMDVFTPQGETIIDFSIYDALRAGFGKFVFVIRKSFEKRFKEIFNEKLKGKAEVAYVYQELDSVPKQFINPKRKKPWGTGHALLLTKDIVTENFAIINADDFYGKEAFDKMAKTLMKTNKESYNFYSIAYYLKNTLSDYGYVSRGECTLDNQDYLQDVKEHTHIEKKDSLIVRKTEDGANIAMDAHTTVSMNFWGFTPKCFEFGTNLFYKFLEVNTQSLDAEFFLPTVVNHILQSRKAKIKVIKTDSKWFGVTYREEKKDVQEAILELKLKGTYPKDLWNNGRY